MRAILGRSAGVSHRGKPPDFWAGPGLRAGLASLLVPEEMALTALMAPASRSVLLERNVELAQIESALAEASDGSGKLVLVEGRAGTGKTALVDAAREVADANGMRVVRARATELESGFAWGVARELFSPSCSPRHKTSSTNCCKGMPRLPPGYSDFRARRHFTPRSTSEATRRS